MPREFNGLLTTFRMPLFFLVTGYLFSYSKYALDFKGLFKNRSLSLLLPYLSACILFYFVKIAQKYVEGNLTSATWYELILSALYGNGSSLSKLSAAPLWFLVSLFCATMIFWGTSKLLNNLSFSVQSIVYLAIGSIGFIISKYIELPWGIDVAIVAQPFMFLGQHFKKIGLLNKIKFFEISTLIVLVIFVANYFINSSVDMNERVYNNLLLFYVGGISGSILAFKLTKILVLNKTIVNIFSYLGANSLMILLFHSHGLTASSILLRQISPNTLPFEWAVCIVMSICISLTIAQIINKFSTLNFIFNGKGAFKPSIANEKTCYPNTTQ